MKKAVSMTGFGRGESSNGAYVVEVRSVNHRYLDIGLKLPRQFSQFEERTRKLVGSYHSRGHVDLYLNVNGEREETMRLEVNWPLANQYRQCFEELRNEFSLAGSPELALYAGLREIIVPAGADLSPERLEAEWPLLLEALEAALAGCRAMRESEGENLQSELTGRLQAFETTVEEIFRQIPDLTRKRREGLEERLATLLQEIEIDPMRLAQEVAILVDKADVTEEIVRLRSHIAQFRQFLGAGEPVGRRLDFLLQEFLREVNTIASKISNAGMAHLTVELKNELEKMREQVQNLE